MFSDAMSNRIPTSILERMVCPVCREPLRENPDGSTVCGNLHTMPFKDGYLDASETAAETPSSVIDSFGYEWNAFPSIQDEDEIFWRTYFKDVPLESLKEGVGLDAGCGKGRYSFYTAPYLESLVALDASTAIQAAARNLESIPNVALIRANLAAAPFRDGSFDLVYCLGVLHLFEKPQEGFRALTRLLAPGGLLLIYVFSRPTAVGVRFLALKAAGLLRRVTVKLPHSALRLLCAPIAVLLYLLFVVPGKIGQERGIRFLGSLPLYTYRGKPLRSLWLDTFDRLSPQIEHRFVWAELDAWFKEADLQVVAAREDTGWYVLLQSKQ